MIPLGPEYVVLDVETTGLEPGHGHRIVEIAAVLWRDRRELIRFSSLVDPGRPSDPGALAAHGLTEELLDGALPFDRILPTVDWLIRDRRVVAYNAPFDVGFLRAEFRLAGAELPPFTTTDVLQLARRALPNLGRYPQIAVVRALGLPTPVTHRAMADVDATSAILHALIDEEIRR